MIERILLAVDDSPDSLAAARLAIDLARTLAARLRIVHVSSDHLLDNAIQTASGTPAADVRRAQAAAAVLSRVAQQARTAGVEPETVLLGGDAGPAVLDDAQQWHADLVVMGKSARSVRGEPYVGSQTRHVLEFADQPVLVVSPHRHQPAARAE